MGKSYVILKDAPVMDYMHDYVALPKNYGSYEYFHREDVKAIRETVFAALDDLDARTGLTEEVKGYKKVIIKPNLVNVYHKAGFAEEDYPETTDPRVFEAVVNWFRDRNDHVVIAESSGKPFPASASFVITGYDRIAKHYGCELVPLERRPVARYMLPKAEVMKEILIPDLFDEIVTGDAFYVSVPKMKTNIYTGVTLGFKNAMGTIPYFLRERNHTHDINKKLADMLYLFKPNCTVIDGIIGGEGNTPGPNDPVLFDRIICGTNAVEVDRVTTELMGFDPAESGLLKSADKKGFGDPNVEIIGEKRVVPFRQAEPTLLSERFKKHWPGVREFVGYTNPHVKPLTKLDGIPFEDVYAMEQYDRGGTPSSLGTCFEVFYASYTYPLTKMRHLNVIVGEGAEFEGEKYWLSDDGHAYSLEELKALPGLTVVVGENSAPAKEAASHPFFFIRGWGEVNNLAVRMAASMMPTLPGQADLVWLPWIGIGAIRKYLIKVGFAALGQPTDMTYDAFRDGPYTIPELEAQNLDVDCIEAPLPQLDLKDRWKAIKEVRLLAQFLI